VARTVGYNSRSLNGRIPRNRNVGERDTEDSSYAIRVGYDLEHQFSENWQIRNAFRFSRVDIGMFQPSLSVSYKPYLLVGGAVDPLLSPFIPTALGKWRSGTRSCREHFNFVAEALGKQEAAQQAWNRYYQRIKELKIAFGRAIMAVLSPLPVQINPRDTFHFPGYSHGVVRDAEIMQT
jgi:hypothetical protein